MTYGIVQEHTINVINLIDSLVGIFFYILFSSFIFYILFINFNAVYFFSSFGHLLIFGVVFLLNLDKYLTYNIEKKNAVLLLCKELNKSERTSEYIILLMTGMIINIK